MCSLAPLVPIASPLTQKQHHILLRLETLWISRSSREPMLNDPVLQSKSDVVGQRFAEEAIRDWCLFLRNLSGDASASINKRCHR